MPSWKRLVIVSFSWGAGFAVGFSVIAGAILWYTLRPQRPKPWDKAVITGTFDYIDPRMMNWPIAKVCCLLRYPTTATA